MKSEELTDLEKFCIHSILFCDDAEFLDIAYRLTRKKETAATDPSIVHRMALRWLREDERVLKYISDLGYKGVVDSSGNKRFEIDDDAECMKIK